jgi:FAD/FMN-containing dehydrogenase
MDLNLKKEQLLKSLQGKLPSETILSHQEDCSHYGGDWTRMTGDPLLVFLPKTTEQVSEILKSCQKIKIPVIPSGGRTGLSGGAVVTSNEVVLNLSKMNQISPVDTLGRTVRVQAGAVTENVHEHCSKEGLLWPIDLASKGTCEIGGNLATNAGGVRVIRYGMARKWVSGLQIVTMNGDIIELNRGLEKNNTGYDLIQLMVGSEGTLAVITEATLKLVRLPQKEKVLFFSLPSLQAISSFFENARKGPFEILAFEFFSQKCLSAVENKLKRKSKLQKGAQFYVLMEIELGIGVEAEQKLDEWLNSILEKEFVQDGLMAQSSEEKKEVWSLREGITESIALTNEVRKYDTSVAVNKTVEFVTEAEKLFQSMNLQAELYLFGHFGDGSPHLNVVRKDSADHKTFVQDCERFEAELYPLIKKWGGSASSEHGVGLLKKSWVEFSRTPQELSLFKAIKSAFDPQGLLNPGKIFSM